MRQSGVELAIGDAVQLQDHLLTVIDIQGDEITFRLDQVEEVDSGARTGPFSLTDRRPPR
jgi:hypothetical protein